MQRFHWNSDKNYIEKVNLYQKNRNRPSSINFFDINQLFGLLNRLFQSFNWLFLSLNPYHNWSRSKIDQIWSNLDEIAIVDSNPSLDFESDRNRWSNLDFKFDSTMTIRFRTHNPFSLLYIKFSKPQLCVSSCKICSLAVNWKFTLRIEKARKKYSKGCVPEVDFIVLLKNRTGTDRFQDCCGL